MIAFDDPFEEQWQTALSAWLKDHPFSVQVETSDPWRNDDPLSVSVPTVTDTIQVSYGESAASQPLLYLRPAEGEPVPTASFVLDLLVQAQRTVTTMDANEFYHEFDYADDADDEEEGWEAANDAYQLLQQRAVILREVVPSEEVAFLVSTYDHLYDN